MAPHSSTLAWKIPWMEEPGRLQSMGSLRVGHNWATSLFTFMHWRRKWQPTPVFLPRETGEPVGLPSMGSHRVGHDWSDLAAVAAAGSSTLLELTQMHSFLWLSNIPSYVCTTSPLSIHLLTDVRWFPIFRLLGGVNDLILVPSFLRCLFDFRSWCEVGQFHSPFLPKSLLDFAIVFLFGSI